MSNGDKDKEVPYEHQPTMETHGSHFDSQPTIRANASLFETTGVNQRTESGFDDVKAAQKRKTWQSDQRTTNGRGMNVSNGDFLSNQLNALLNNNKNGYFKNLDHYKSDPKYKIDPNLHLVGDDVEVENFILNEKIYLTTYIQYIDVYEGTTAVEEKVEEVKEGEEEEVEYVELPKYVTKYKPKIIIDTIEKTIEVPSGEEIKKPKYNNVDVPYIIPNLIENEILVVLKKIIQPEIEISNEVLEIEVEKYIPKLIPVNVYVPRYFGISAKAKGTAEESFRYVDLTQEQIDGLMKELNPHLEELRLFNENQLKRMEEYIKESRQQALSNNFEVPEPLAVSYDENGNCKNFEYSEFNKIKESYLSEMIH